MLTVADVLRRHGPAYLERHATTMPVEQKRVLRCIMACRTGELGTVHYACRQCGQAHVMGRSCGNRHCPSCQSEKGGVWCERQLARLLPCHYFLLTFTVPQAFREFARRHPRAAYAAMFRASSDALKTLAADPKRLGVTTLGFFGALHTWGRDLNYHPHLHYVVPGGGLDAEGQWRQTPTNFFLPCQPLSLLYRGKLRAALDAEGLLDEVDDSVWSESWVVDCQAVGDGAAAVKYLAPYVFRVALSDKRIVACDEQSVTFRYRRSGSQRWRTMRLDADEFVRRFLQHVLPRGLQKVRHYGFLSPRAGQSIESLKWLVAAALGLLFWLAWTETIIAPPTPDFACSECGGPLMRIRFEPPPPPRPIPTSQPP
ncbi:IS91 family transposase [Lignipirellula cremea]